MSADLNDERWRYVLLPVYLTTYTFGDESYHVMVDASGAMALPRDLLLAAGVEREATAKLTPDGILIERREGS